MDFANNSECYKLYNWIKIEKKQGDLDEAQEITAVWCGNVKKLNFVAAILDFWRPSWIGNEEFLKLYSIHDNDHLYQFW